MLGSSLKRLARKVVEHTGDTGEHYIARTRPEWWAIGAAALGGGALMGVGAQMARGCASGQALSGGAVLSVGSWAFALSIFASGYALAWFVRRLWN